MPTPPAQPESDIDLEIEWHLPRHPRSVSRARTLLREQATAWKLPDGVTDTAVLLLSELMTNAYRHAKVPRGREIWARCVLDPDHLRVSVTDADDTLPKPREATPDDASGRGLALVAALADDWGAEARACGIGKTVWFTVATSPSESVRDDASDQP